MIRNLLPLFHALLLFTSYIALINDLRAKVIIVMGGIKRIRELYIAFPFLHETILVFLILLALACLTKDLKKGIAIMLIALVALLARILLIPFIIPVTALITVVMTSLDKKLAGRLGEHVKKIAEAETTIIATICAYSVLRYFVYLIVGGSPFRDPSWTIVELHAKLITSLQPLSMLIYCAMPIIGIFSLVKKKSSLFAFMVNEEANEWLSRKHALIILLASTALVIIQCLTVFSPVINPRGLAIGVDTLYYRFFLEELIRKGPKEALVLSPARSLYLLLTYVIWYFTRLSPKTIIELMPSILFPLVIVSSYFMVLKLTKSHTIAALSSLMHATSPQVTTYLYASFQANILGLIIMYSVLAAYYMRNKYALLWAVFASLLLQFIHPWTAFHMLIFLVLFILFTKRYKKRYDILMITMVLIGIVAGDQLKVIITGNLQEATTDLAERCARKTIFETLKNILTYPEVLYRTVASYCKGFLNYPLLILILISQLTADPQLTSFGASWILPLAMIYISPMSYTPRLILNMPAHALIGALLSKLRKNKMLIAVIVIVSLSYSLMCIVNLSR